MGKRKDSSIQLTHIKIHESGRKNRRSHPAVIRIVRWLFFLCGSFSLHLWFDTLFQLDLSVSFLAVSTLILGAWYFFTFLFRKTRIICIPISMAVMVIVLVRMWDVVYQGIGQIINTASQYIMDYYYTNPGFLPVEPDAYSVMVTMFLLEALIMLWIGSSVLLRGRAGSLFLGALVLLCMGLSVNRFPSPWAILLWAVSFFAVRSVRSPLKTERSQSPLPAVGIGIAVFAAAMVLVSWLFISPKLDDVLIARYPALREFQDDLEDKMEELFDGKGSGNWQGMVQNGVLSNNAPSGENKTALTMTVNSKPEHTIYLKGFIGNIYQGTYWDEISQENFQNAVQDQYSYGVDASDYENLNGTEIGYSVMQQYLADGPYENEGRRSERQPVDFTMIYQDTAGDFVYAPYLSSVETENVEYYADVELRRTNDNAVQGSFYPEVRVTGNTDYTSSYLVAESSVYHSYVTEEYLFVPSEGLDQLKEQWSSVLEEYQDMTGHYPTLSETTTLIRQMLSDCSYSLNLDPVPEGEDFVEYFLFQQKKGYCTHFASTSVLLYRLAGYPARYATGYIARPDEFKKDSNGAYSADVPGKNAHAWVEVYQDNGSGWLPVEMTPGYGEEEEDSQLEEGRTSATPTPTDVPEREDTQEPENHEDTQDSAWQIPAALLGILIAVSAAAGTVLFLILRRKVAIKIRISKFQNRNRQKAMQSLVYEADKMLSASGFQTERGILDKEYAQKVQKAFPNMRPGSFLWFMEQGERAAYSNEMVSAKTVAECIRIFGALEQEISRGRGRLWRLWWRFIKCYR